MHQPSRSPSPVIQASSDRGFGLVFAVFFGAVGLLPLLQGNAPRLWAVVAAGVTLVVAMLAPALLRPFNRLWTRFGTLLHSVVSPVALAVVFFGVVTPTGLLMRLFGKDLLGLRFDRNAASYWVKRTPPGPTADSLRQQF
jgi:hypothetical protein